MSNVQFKKEVVPASTADPCKCWFQWPSSAVKFGAVKVGNDIIVRKDREEVGKSCYRPWTA